MNKSKADYTSSRGALAPWQSSLWQQVTVSRLLQSLHSLAMRSVFIAATSLLPSSLYAAEWKIIPEQSSIEFMATYGKDKVVGAFTEFDGDIMFDPKAPEKSHIVIHVKMDKVESEDKDAKRYLPMAEWFAAKEFPVSEFTVGGVKKISGTEFEADGVLKIRDKTASVKLPFTLDIKDGENGDTGKQFASMNGTAVIKRLDYGVGQGEWSATDVIANDVSLKIHLDAVSK